MTTKISRYAAKQKYKAVASLVAKRTQLTTDIILGADRITSNSLDARHCTMWLCHFGMQFGWSQIKHASGKDHTTVINGVRRFGFIMTQNEFWRRVAHEVLDDIALGKVDEIVRRVNTVTVDPLLVKPKEPRAPAEGRADVSMYDRDGDRGTSRAYLEDQNERFLAALRKAHAEESA